MTKIAPVDIYRILKRYDENGRLHRDYIMALSREIADMIKQKESK